MKLLPSLERTPWLTAMSGFSLSILLALTLALFGWFHPVLTIISLGFLFGGLAIALRTLYRSRDMIQIVAIAGLSFIALITTIQATPSIFTGRDQGSIGIAAWHLAQNHELAFRSPASDLFFEIYGPGRALNFPGFSYTDTGALITQFPLGYISYLALFVSWFGLSGLLIANGFLFVVSGWTFLELALVFVSRRSAFLATALFATSFITLWLTKLTLTENLALLLYLGLTFALVRIDRDQDARFLPLAILISFLFALTRIEGFVIATLTLSWILYRPHSRALVLALPKHWFIPSLLFFAFLFLRDLFMNLPFYTMIAKAGVKYWNELSGVAGSTGTSEPALGPILFSYGLFPIFLLGIAALLFGLMKRRYTLFLPLLVAAPTLIYLINGHISDDHPWLLRRYAFTLFPFFLLATTCLIENISQRVKNDWSSPALTIVFGILFAFQAYPALQTLRSQEQSGLLEQTEYVSTLITERDLLLIDRGASGDPFALIAGPLSSIHNRNAVYFFNPEDYTRMDRSKFDRIYLLTAEDGLGRYAEAFGENLLPLQTITFSFPRLTTLQSFDFPVIQPVKSDTLLFQITE